MRPTVSVFNHKNPSEVLREVRTPQVFSTAIRNDIVQFVHDNLSKNTRQARGVDPNAGMKHSAESWGTGRAAARIPRIGGSGTSRSGQGAFGNMCRKGRMSFPLHVWRRWHRKVNLRQRRHALASALAASSVWGLVNARGHRIENLPQLPLVLDNQVNLISQTKEAVKMLKAFGLYDDVERVVKAKSLRPGRGKMRNRRFKKRRGPLVVVDNEAQALERALRNIAGVDVLNVNRLNIRNLAPGGQLGRLLVFTEGALAELKQQFGSLRGSGTVRKNYLLRREVLSNPDIGQIINSNEVQKCLRAKRTTKVLHTRQRKNPFRNRKHMDYLNPFNKELREQRQKGATKTRRIRKDRKAFTNKSKAQLNALIKKVDSDQTRLYDEFSAAMEDIRV
jgi:large subunit ribosomal protein L4e